MRAVQSTPSEMGFIFKWLFMRSLPVPSLDELPEMGITVLDDQSNPVAAGFIRRCEGGMAIIDSAVTKPDAEAVVRHKAMELLGKSILEVCASQGYHRVISFSVDENTLKRLQTMGFQQSPLAVMSLDLRNRSK